MGYDLRILFIAAVIIVAIFIVIKLVKKKSGKAADDTSASAHSTSAPAGGTPSSTRCITVTYKRSGALLEDGKCGWLDVEGPSGEESYKLNFNHKAATPIVIPLEAGDYIVTYRTKSKAAMIAENVASAVNEGNGGLGAAANAIYKAGGMSGQLSSISVSVSEGFNLKLECTTDGLEKSCEIIG